MSDVLNALLDAQAEIASLKSQLADARDRSSPRADFLKELRAKNLARVGAPTSKCKDIDGWTPADWAVNLAGEVGEALNVLKKMRRLFVDREEMESFPQSAKTIAEWEALEDHFADELADAMICLDLLAARMRLDVETIVRRKFNKTSDKWGSDVRL